MLKKSERLNLPEPKKKLEHLRSVSALSKRELNKRKLLERSKLCTMS